jgi:5'(3')-deoxyribonucleotidase
MIEIGDEILDELRKKYSTQVVATAAAMMLAKLLKSKLDKDQVPYLDAVMLVFFSNVPHNDFIPVTQCLLEISSMAEAMHKAKDVMEKAAK